MDNDLTKSVTTNAKPVRNTSFEILRIIAMLCIVAHHFAAHGAFDFSSFDSSALIVINSAWIEFLTQLGRLGVALFMLISVFFLSAKTDFKLKRLLSMVIEVLVFSLVLGVTFYFVNNKTFSPDLLTSIIFPIGRDTWWFMTVYFLIYLFHPLLNIAIRGMNRKVHLYFIVVLSLIWCILPTFLQVSY